MILQHNCLSQTGANMAAWPYIPWHETSTEITMSRTWQTFCQLSFFLHLTCLLSCYMVVFGRLAWLSITMHVKAWIRFQNRIHIMLRRRHASWWQWSAWFLWLFTSLFHSRLSRNFRPTLCWDLNLSLVHFLGFTVLTHTCNMRTSKRRRKN